MNERRADPRFGHETRVYVELVSDSPDGDLPPAIIRGATINVSEHGLQLTTAEPIMEHAVLRLFIEVADEEAPLQLVGEVRWCRPRRDHFLSGFYLFESEYTAFKVWRDKVGSLSEDDIVSSRS